MTEEKKARNRIAVEHSLPPWKTHPHLYRDRVHFAEVVLNASETSSYYEGLPLSTSEEMELRKQELLDELRKLYPDD